MRLINKIGFFALLIMFAIQFNTVKADELIAQYQNKNTKVEVYKRNNSDGSTTTTMKSKSTNAKTGKITETIMVETKKNGKTISSDIKKYIDGKLEENFSTKNDSSISTTNKYTQSKNQNLQPVDQIKQDTNHYQRSDNQTYTNNNPELNNNRFKQAGNLNRYTRNDQASSGDNSSNTSYTNSFTSNASNTPYSSTITDYRAFFNQLYPNIDMFFGTDENEGLPNCRNIDCGPTFRGYKGIYFGKRGDDSLIGYSQAIDVYYFEMMNGNDRIVDNIGKSVILFGSGIGRDNISFSKNNEDLIINYYGGSIKYEKFFDTTKTVVENERYGTTYTLTTNNLESIEFLNGDRLIPKSEIMAKFSNIAGNSYTSNVSSNLDNMQMQQGSQYLDNNADKAKNEKVYEYLFRSYEPLVLDNLESNYFHVIKLKDATFEDFKNHKINILKENNDLIFYHSNMPTAGRITVKNYFNNREQSLYKIMFESENTPVYFVSAIFQQGNPSDIVISGNKTYIKYVETTNATIMNINNAVNLPIPTNFVYKNELNDEVINLSEINDFFVLTKMEDTHYRSKTLIINDNNGNDVYSLKPYRHVSQRSIYDSHSPTILKHKVIITDKNGMDYLIIDALPEETIFSRNLTSTNDDLVINFVIKDPEKGSSYTVSTSLRDYYSDENTVIITNFFKNQNSLIENIIFTRGANTPRILNGNEIISKLKGQYNQ